MSLAKKDGAAVNVGVAERIEALCGKIICPPAKREFSGLYKHLGYDMIPPSHTGS